MNQLASRIEEEERKSEREILGLVASLKKVDDNPIYGSGVSLKEEREDRKNIKRERERNLGRGDPIITNTNTHVCMHVRSHT